MKTSGEEGSVLLPGTVLSNAEIADHLASLAQLLSLQKENPYRVKAYQRAAATIRTLSESIDQLVRDGSDLTEYAGIGQAISSAIREIVLTGTLGKLEKLRSQASPEIASISDHPRLDPRRVLRIYKKLGISTIDALRESLENGDIEKQLGIRMAQHVRQGITPTHSMLLYRADELRVATEEFLMDKCGVRRAEVVGDYRRRVEVIDELAFLIETNDLPSVISKLERYGGRTPMLSCSKDTAVFALPAGVLLRIQVASKENWGMALVACTGSKAHLRKLTTVTGSLKTLKSNGPFSTESALYRKFALSFIEPELREGHDEVQRAAQGILPVLVSLKDIRGELHAHSTSSDGSHSIEQMAVAVRERGYDYIGITDHSQSLKLARGVSVEDLLKQIRLIDKLNKRIQGVRILKSAEVDILADGSLDYPDEVLRELDYTVCSIHSRFGFGKTQQTERILRAMDNRYFNVLGHATGRLLLKRPGYEIDFERVIAHAKQNSCFFEINSSPDRLDLSAENARAAAMAGVKIAVSTDAHSTREFELIRYGTDQAGAPDWKKLPCSIAFPGRRSRGSSDDKPRSPLRCRDVRGTPEPPSNEVGFASEQLFDPGQHFNQGISFPNFTAIGSRSFPWTSSFGKNFWTARYAVFAANALCFALSRYPAEKKLTRFRQVPYSRDSLTTKSTPFSAFGLCLRPGALLSKAR